eukprot:1150577-Pelagomonas_calceolata.AAC.7
MEGPTSAMVPFAMVPFAMVPSAMVTSAMVPHERQRREAHICTHSKKLLKFKCIAHVRVLRAVASAATLQVS